MLAFYKKLINVVKPWYRGNDDGHDLVHVTMVAKECLNINRSCELGLNEEMLLTSGLIHDKFTNQREIHHELIEAWVLRNKNHYIFSRFTDHEVILIAKACGEHRASYTGEYTSIYSEVLSSADRGKPGNVTAMLDRAMKFNGGNRHDAIVHLKEKFGSGGYARYPPVYLTAYNRELKVQQDIINNL